MLLFIEFFRAFPDSFTHPEHIFEDGDWGIIEWHGGGTFTGAFGAITPTGRSFTLCGCGFFRVTDGKIAFQRGYFDRYTWFSQLDILFREHRTNAKFSLDKRREIHPKGRAG